MTQRKYPARDDIPGLTASESAADTRFAELAARSMVEVATSYGQLSVRKIPVESALHVDHSKLPVLAFAVGSHRPEKTNAITVNRYVWMIPTRH